MNTGEPINYGLKLMNTEHYILCSISLRFYLTIQKKKKKWIKLLTNYTIFSQT